MPNELRQIVVKSLVAKEITSVREVKNKKCCDTFNFFPALSFPPYLVVLSSRMLMESIQLCM
jgi:hypothetical protein